MQKPDLYGVFEIEEFQLNGKERVHYKDSVRWEHIKILSTRGLTIKNLNGKRLFFRHNIDTLNSEIELISYRDSTKKRLLTYEL
jgi:hypothetical protein